MTQKEEEEIKWITPDWMKQYIGLIVNIGSYNIEELMNSYCAIPDVYNNTLRATHCAVAKSQVELLEKLHMRGLLMEKHK